MPRNSYRVFVSGIDATLTDSVAGNRHSLRCLLGAPQRMPMPMPLRVGLLMSPY